MRGRHGRIGAAAALALGIVALAPAGALAQSDLAIDKTDSADPATVGQQYEYALAVSNGGPQPADGVAVTDTLPNRVDFVSVTASQGTCTLQGSKRVNCELGSIAAGEGASIDILVKAMKAGTVSNTAEVSAATGDDPTPGNDTDTEATVIQEPGAGGQKCDGIPVTIVGTPGNDNLVGTDKRDVIDGLSGDDEIIGMQGRDIICAGKGNDVVKGRGNSDFVKGGGGEDRIRGNSGDDRLRGNGANDNIGGGRGHDILSGGKGDDDVCRGGKGRDSRRGCE